MLCAYQKKQYHNDMCNQLMLNNTYINKNYKFVKICAINNLVKLNNDFKAISRQKN